MNIPQCPNNKQSTALCERSQLRLLGENDHAFTFLCGCCKLIWAVSKPMTKERGAWEARMRRVQQATEMEREAASRRKYSFATR